MKRWYLTAGLLLCVTPLLVAQNTSSTNKPSGTKVVGHHTEAVVQPKIKPVQLDRSTVQAAQKQLKVRGYNVGQEDGIAGPETRAAVEKFQADQGLTQNGRLDAATLAKLDVGGTQIVGSAPADLGRGGKAAGHDFKEGHPIDAAKAMGKGSESFGKKVAEGTKSLAVGGVRKVGKDMSKLGNKIDQKTNGTSGQTQSSQANPPQQ
jgi:peptidoglycan hydrolase-like protein with peptidoglycan-binding domain